MSPLSKRLDQLPMLAPSPWQMSFGERAALEGILAQLRPELALEIGTAEGGSLSRVAAWSAEVHSFDLVPPPEGLRTLENVTWHTGDSHEHVVRVLAELADAGRSVDFILVDGDHTTDGVRRDVEDILDSDAVKQTLIVLHDTMNDVVRAGLEAVDYGRYPKVGVVEFDLVPGYLARAEPYRLELWGGLGLITVDEAQSAGEGHMAKDPRFHELLSLVRPTRDVMRDLEAHGVAMDGEPPPRVEQLIRDRVMPPPEAPAEPLRGELELCRQRLVDLEQSLSWRATEPLRALKRRAIRRGAR